MEWNENTEKWVQALESGDYDQTRSTLVGPALCDAYGNDIVGASTKDGYCCLGVAAKVFGWLDDDDRVTAWFTDADALGSRRLSMTDPSGEPGNWMVESSDSNLLPPHQDFLGLTSEEQSILIGMNDGVCATFKEIAAALRECQQNPNALL